MTNTFTANVTLLLQATPTRVWEALTTPAQIAIYFFGTEAVSGWNVGDSLLFKGEWEGTPYIDKGTILAIEPPRLLRYDYLSSFSGLEDVPENYATITYELVAEGTATRLNITQDGIATDEARQHSEANWASILEGLRALVEAA